MITVQLDELGYFTGSYAKIGSIPNGVKVNSLPPDLSNHKTTCWKFGEYEVEVEVPVIKEENGMEVVSVETVKETKIGWIFDETKHKALLKEIEEIQPTKTQEEINAELIAKNEELESTLDVILTEIIPSLTAMLG